MSVIWYSQMGVMNVIIKNTAFVLIFAIWLTFFGCSRKAEITSGWKVSARSELVYIASWRDGGSVGFTLTRDGEVGVLHFCMLQRAADNGERPRTETYVGKLYPGKESVLIQDDRSFLRLVFQICLEEIDREMIQRVMRLENGQPMTNEELRAESRWVNSLPNSHRIAAFLGARILLMVHDSEVFERGDWPETFGSADL